MEQNKNQNSNFFSFSLSHVDSLPKFVENTKKDFVLYGKDNKYPLMLVELLNSANMFGQLVRSISQQVAGFEIKIKNNTGNSKLQAFINSCNSKKESLHDVIKKIAFDDLLFGGYSMSNVWNRGKEFELYHTDFSTLRSGKMDVTGNVNEYYFSSDWTKQNTVPTKYPAFSEGNKLGTQIYYIKNTYTPSFVYYPLPSWIHGINWAMLDAKISEWHNSNLDNGFFPSLFLNYNNGVVSDEKAEQIYRNLKQQFEGSSKAGRIILSFSNGKDTSPDIHKLNSNDDDKKFTVLAELVRSQILCAFGVVSPELVGIKDSGRLGDNNFIEASQLFFNTVIRLRQSAIEKEINYLLSVLGYGDEIEITPLQPVQFSLPDDTMQKVFTIDEIRAMVNVLPMENSEIGKQIVWKYNEPMRGAVNSDTLLPEPDAQQQQVSKTPFSIEELKEQHKNKEK